VIIGFGETPTTLIDLGGPPYLLPLANKSKVYDLAKIVVHNLSNDSHPDGFFVGGSGAGPWPLAKSNCEVC